MKMRLSYSFLSAWYRGDIDNAIAIYFHNAGKYSEDEEQRMEDGRILHEQVERTINATGMLPDWLSRIPLGRGRAEVKVTPEYDENFTLSGVFDYLDEENGIIYDWKFGTTSSLEWANTWQIPFYFLICERAGIPVKTARVVRHNQYEKKTDWCVVHNCSSAIDLAINVIETIGGEARVFFEREGLLDAKKTL